MPNDNDEGFDVYADQFTVTITPFGSNLSFGVHEPHPSTGRQTQSTTLGTVRMSVEHLKTMVIILRRQIIRTESESGIKAEVPRAILNQLSIPPGDWDTFWESTD